MANRGIELGAGYVSLTVSTQGLGRELNAEFGRVPKAAEDAGKKAGGLLGRGLGAGAKQGADEAKRAAEDAASARVAADRKAQQSAAALEAAQAKTARAEDAYAKAVKAGGAESTSAKEAHAKLTTAKLAEADAATRAKSADQAHQKAIQEAARAADQADQAANRYGRSLAGLSAKASAGIASPFRKLAEAADKDGRISGNRLVQGVKLGAGRLSDAVGSNPFGRVVQQAEAAGKQAGSKLHDGIKGSVGKITDLVKGGLVGVGVGAATSIGGVLTAGFGRYTALEDARAKLQGLGHDAKTVEGIMGSALTSVKGTSHGMAEAAAVSASLVASGIKPGQQLTGVLSTVANSASIAGMSMQDMGAIFGKAAAMGKVDGEILNQLAENGVPAIQWLADETGMSAAEVMKAASAGKISFSQFTSAMEKGSGSAAQALGKTTTGSIRNFGASIGRLGESVITAFAGEGGIAAFFQRLTGGVDDLQSKVGPGVERIKAILAPLTTGQFLGSDKTGMEEDSPIVAVLFRIREIAIEVTGGIRAFAEAWKAMDGDITSSGFAGFMEQLAFNLRSGFEGTSGALQGMWAVVGPILDQVWSAIAIKWAELQPRVQQIFSTIAAAVGDAMTVVQSIIQIVTGIIAFIWQTWGTQITWIVTNLVASVVMVFQGFANIVGGIFKAIAGLLTGDWSKMGDGLKQITQGIGQVLGGIFRAIGATLLGIFDGIVVGIGRVWDGITSKVRTPVVAVIDVVWKGFGAAWGAVASFLGLRSFPDRPKGWARGGVLPGFRPVTGGDDQWVPMRSGEGVSVSEAMRDPYERDRLLRLNRAALQGPSSLARFRAAEANAAGGLAEGGFVLPVPGGWNLRWPSYPGHTGVDAAAPKGTVIRALRDGYVSDLTTYTTRSRYWGVTPGYGINTVINHGAFATRYAHQSGRAPLLLGQPVRAGQVIGYVGDTGKATGDHLHFEVLSGGRPVNPVPYLSGATAGSGGATGPSFNPIQMFLDKITEPFRAFRDRLEDSPVGRMALAGAERIRDGAVDKIKSVAGAIVGAVAGVGNRALGMGMAASRGWVGGEWTALEKLWTKESNWSTSATNPSSGAYGIPQALPASKMASAGADWRTNPATQIRWGLDYIAGRYGRPSAAWAHSQATNWYKAGTNHALAGPAIVGEDGPELMWLQGGERIRPVARPHDVARTLMYDRAAAAGMTVHNPVFHVTVDAADLREVGSVIELMNRLGLEANRIGG